MATTCLYCGINDAELKDYRSQHQGTAHEQVGTYPACKPCFNLDNDTVWALSDLGREATIEQLLKFQSADAVRERYDVTQAEIDKALKRRSE